LPIEKTRLRDDQVGNLIGKRQPIANHQVETHLLRVPTCFDQRLATATYRGCVSIDCNDSQLALRGDGAGKLSVASAQDQAVAPPPAGGLNGPAGDLHGVGRQRTGTGRLRLFMRSS